MVFVQCVGSRDHAKGMSYCSQDLLHVHRQAHHALQAQGARRPGARLLHGHPRRRQGLRRVRPPGHRGGRRRVHPRPRQPHLPRRRQGHGLGLRHARRRAGRDRRRPGRAGHGHAAAAGRRASWRRSSTSATTSTASSTRRTPSCGRSRPTPPASSWPAPARRRGHPRVGGAGQRRRRQGAGPVQRRRARARADRGASSTRTTLHRLLRAASASAPTAPSSSARSAPWRARSAAHVARVNPGVCLGCGTCVAVCPCKSVELEGFTDEQVYQRDQRPGGEWHERCDFEPRIIAFVCNWCTYTGADLAGTSRLQMASNVRIIRLPCTGRIDPLFIVKAFERGADGVIVSGCHPADCHYTSGNYHARRRFAVFRELMELHGHRPRARDLLAGSPPARAPSGRTSSTRPSPACASSARSTPTATHARRAAPDALWSEGVETGAANRTPETEDDAAADGLALGPPNGANLPAAASSSVARGDPAAGASCEGAPAARRHAPGRRHGRRRHRLGGEPQRRPPGVRHQRRPTPGKLIFDARCVHDLATYLNPRRKQSRALGKRVGIVVKGCDAKAVAGLRREAAAPGGPHDRHRSACAAAASSADPTLHQPPRGHASRTWRRAAAAATCASRVDRPSGRRARSRSRR